MYRGNTVDPDETAHLDLQCLQIQLLLCLALLRVKPVLKYKNTRTNYVSNKFIIKDIF